VTPPFSATVWRSDGVFVATCLQNNLEATGVTEEEALSNLRKMLDAAEPSWPEERQSRGLLHSF
jgi:hypothetical protein